MITRVEAAADQKACGRGEDGRDCCGGCQRAVRQDPAVEGCRVWGVGCGT